MITLFTFGTMFGLPDPSPLVTKAEVLLKLSGLAYRTDPTGFSKAPKGKLPYIDDDGEHIADSTFIRAHLERRHNIDFDRGLTPGEVAIGWAFEKMCEEHLYWAIVDSRWMVEANFDIGPRRFFDQAPAPIRPLVVAAVRRKMRRALRAQGFGRHTRAEIEQLAKRDIDAMAQHLGDKPWFCGPEPRGVDATIWSFAAGAACPHFTTPIADHVRAHANLVAYVKRGTTLWYPSLAATSG